MTTTEETFEQLHEWFRSMRAESPVTFEEQQGMEFVQLFGYPEVYTALTEHADFSSDLGAYAPKQDEFELFAKGNFVQLDPPEHGNLRGLVSQAFTPKVIADLEPRIRRVTDELLDEAGTEFDLVEALAYPLPVIVIAELLGIPTSDRPLFRRWADILLSQQTGDSVAIDDEQLAAITPTMREMNEYLLEHIRHRRAHPGDDLTSRLVATEADGRVLTDEEIVGFVGLLLIAGHITTTALLGNSVLILDKHPELFARLRADRSLVPAAIEEFLRVRSPFPRTGRITTRELELGGVTIPKGKLVLAWLASANRDARQFDDPDTVRIERHPNHHLAFGKGIHFCIGAPLARLEARVALNRLLDCYRRLAVCGEPALFPAMTMAAAKHLPVTGSLA